MTKGDLQGGFGSLVAVSVLGCEIACEAATGCDSFSFNAVQQQCFLKNGGSKTTCPVSISPANLNLHHAVDRAESIKAVS